MLLFQPEHKPMILEGRKTHTRRLWKKARCRVGSIHQARTELFGKPFALLRILRIWQERLGDIGDEDVRHEGYDSRDEFFEVFRRVNRLADEEDVESLPVWCVEFFASTRAKTSPVSGSEPGAVEVAERFSSDENRSAEVRA